MPAFGCTTTRLSLHLLTVLRDSLFIFVLFCAVSFGLVLFCIALFVCACCRDYLLYFSSSLICILLSLFFIYLFIVY